uniref:prostaglandin-endoperoxide synthase n=1 Tax=Octopus vulgaris TaxID=6645 RepID=A0A6C0PP88_OCTVU|nr:prostaglandin G/H synthase 2 [Octopus vulgaris]
MILIYAVSLIMLTALVNAANPCCSFPCQHRSVCMTKGFDDYMCDCSQTGYYGKNCEIPTFRQTIITFIKPTPDTVHYILTNFPWLWKIINNVPFLNNIVMTYVYISRGQLVDSPPLYVSNQTFTYSDIYYNRSTFVRNLPPVPKDCPTPLGVVGPKVLPDTNKLIEIFRRQEFKPDPMGTSLLFAFMAQHFTHQFFKTDLTKNPDMQWGNQGVDASNIYGKNLHEENLLRTFKDGKMKTQIINNEIWPPHVKDAPVSAKFLDKIDRNYHFAVGHEFFNVVPGLVVFSTVWLREHNRVCDILKEEHPEWLDEQLFQTTKLIIIGEIIKLIIEEYVSHLAHYGLNIRFDPELLFNQRYQYQNRIAIEFNHLYHWHPFIPDTFNINGTMYTNREFYYHPEIVVKHGMKAFVDSLSRQTAGQMTAYNHGVVTLHVAKEIIEHGRLLRLQSFNNYRRRFNLKPYKNFFELTGNMELANILENFYGDVEAVEMYVGMIAEKRQHKSLFGQTIIEMGAPFSVKGLMSSPICSPGWWKPSTFGGDVGFNIVKTQTFKKLFCQNMKDGCGLVSLRIPEWTEEYEESRRKIENEAMYRMPSAKESTSEKPLMSNSKPQSNEL